MVYSNPSERLDGYDLARALAVLGMLLVNFDAFADPVESSPLWLRALIDWIEGRAAVLFIMLAGIGISLKTRTARLSDDIINIRDQRRLLLKRGFVLFSAGLLLSVLWQADILHYYFLFIALGAAVLTVSNRFLLAAALCSVAVAALLLTIFDPDQGWDLTTSTIIDFWTPAGMIRRLFFNGYFAFFPWSSFLLLGMWIGRLDICSAKVRRWLFLAGATAVAGAETAARAFSAWMTNAPNDAESEIFARWVTIDPWTPLPLFVLTGAGTAVMIIALCNRPPEPANRSRLRRSLQAAGRMSLTAYVSHILVGFALGNLMPKAEPSLPAAAGVALIFFAGSLVFCSLWSRRFGKGPLEKLMQLLVCVPFHLHIRRGSFHPAG